MFPVPRPPSPVPRPPFLVLITSLISKRYLFKNGNDLTLLSGKGMWNVCKKIFPFSLWNVIMLSHKASSAVLPHWPTRYLTTMHQKELFINKTYRGKQLSLPHCETLKDQGRLLYNSRESTAINMEPGQRYEILKIWVPNHGAVNVYRSPGGGTEIVLEAYSITRKRIAPKSFPCCCFFFVRLQCG